jgi:hypothetical protein
MKPAGLSVRLWVHYNVLILLEHLIGKNYYRRCFSTHEQKFFLKVKGSLENLTRNPPSEFKLVCEYEGVPDGEELYDPYKVKVFRGAAKEWESVKKWNLDYFAEKHGDQEVTLFANKGLMGKNTVQDFDTIQLRDYITMLRGGSKKYLKFSRLLDETSSLMSDFDHDFLNRFHQPSSFSKLFFFFMGGVNTVTPIHNGFQPTVFVQIEGRKKWIFYPTGDRLFLNVRAERRNYFFSDADIQQKDDPRFPLLEFASPYEIILEPGDVMYFPSLVWHQVENLTDSIGVAYKFVHVPSGWRSSKMMTLLFFLATKPFLPYSIIVSRLKKKDPVFMKRDY